MVTFDQLYFLSLTLQALVQKIFSVFGPSTCFSVHNGLFNRRSTSNGERFISQLMRRVFCFVFCFLTCGFQPYFDTDGLCYSRNKPAEHYFVPEDPSSPCPCFNFFLNINSVQQTYMSSYMMFIMKMQFQL